jgi:hypothetical protein
VEGFNMRKAIWLLLLSPLLLGGCTHYVVFSPAQDGGVYIIRESMLGSEYVYNCLPNNGAPTCWRVEEVHLH